MNLYVDCKELKILRMNANRQILIIPNKSKGTACHFRLHERI